MEYENNAFQEMEINFLLNCQEYLDIFLQNLKEKNILLDIDEIKENLNNTAFVLYITGYQHGIENCRKDVLRAFGEKEPECFKKIKCTCCSGYWRVDMSSLFELDILYYAYHTINGCKYSGLKIENIQSIKEIEELILENYN